MLPGSALKQLQSPRQIDPGRFQQAQIKLQNYFGGGGTKFGKLRFADTSSVSIADHSVNNSGCSLRHQAAYLDVGVTLHVLDVLGDISDSYRSDKILVQWLVFGISATLAEICEYLRVDLLTVWHSRLLQSR